MRKQQDYKIADTNLALFGTQVEKDVKAAAALDDPEWKALKAAKPAVGFKVWRIEKFKVKKWPQEHFGEFYSGDSYILLRTYKEADAIKYDIHFWLGADTSQDEAGTAAFKAVELDDTLGQQPVQHREVQDHESPQFLSYFTDKGGIRILQGGVESAFRHVKPTEYKPRLLHIKGKRNVRVVQVPLSCDSLNSGDVFVLDAGLKLYTWQGAKCSGQERVKAGGLIQALDDERGGKPERISVSESEEKDPQLQEFYGILGGKKGPIHAADNDDDAWEAGHEPELHRITDAGGKLQITGEAKGAIPKTKLDTKDVFMLDVGNEVFVWIGLKASDQEKQKGLSLAQTYLKEKNRPAWLPITKVLEGAENEVFWTYLSGTKRPFAVQKK